MSFDGLLKERKSEDEYPEELLEEEECVREERSRWKPVVDEVE